MSRLQLTAAKRTNELAAKHFPEGLTPQLIALMDDVRAQLVAAYSAGEAAGDTIASEKWSNASNFGYLILASEKIGLAEEDINRLVRALHGIHDMRSVDEAAAHYRNSAY